MPLTLRFVGPDGVVLEQTSAADASGQAELSELPDDFVMTKLRGADGGLHAVTNPIFVV